MSTINFKTNLKKNNKYIALALSLSLTAPTSATSLPLNSTQIITATKNHLLTMLYAIQPKISVEIPVTLTFSDVPKNIWYETAAKYVVSQGILAGTSETNFSPDMHISRGLIAISITNAINADLGYYPNVFHDASNQWYRDSANWCAQNEIMVGYEHNIFGGEDSVTREELAMILYKLQAYLGGNIANISSVALSQYVDHQDASFFGRDSLAWAVNNGLLLGTDNHINPHQPATRAEVAFALYKLIENP